MGVCLRLLVLLCLAICCSGKVPEVFEDYFDQDVQMVDVAQRTALGACLTTPGDLIPDLNAANRECFGGNSHLDWNDFADINTGADADNNGMTNKMEEAEICFYTKLGWLDGRSVQNSKILKHFKSIPDADKKKQFEDDVDACLRWDGSFSSRRKRSIEEELGQENLGSLSLVTLSRTKRQAVGKKTMKKTMKKAAGKKTAGGASGAASGGKGALKGSKGAGLRSGKGMPARKGGKKMGKSKGGKAKGGKGRGPQGQGARGGKQGGRQTAKNPKYNALWCVDLAVQKYLRTCVENILG